MMGKIGVKNGNISLFIIYLCVLSLYASGPTLPKKKSFHIQRSEQRIKVDGILDDAAWKSAVRITEFYEWTPGDNTVPPVRTECWVAYNKTHLFVAFKCLDPDPTKIRAHLMDRDSIETFIQDDHVLFQIDTFNDERRGFQFRINPYGVQADANFSELEGFEDFSWDAIWDSKGKITEEGYTVEVEIPFNQLRFPKSDTEQTWGFSASRSYPRNARHRMNSHPHNRNLSCIICQHNKISGFVGMSAGKNLEFSPTLTLNRTDTNPSYPQEGLERGDLQFEPGISARWGITSNLILNATVNPDFSNVEADIAQLDVNTRFALRFPEKRPFFLEGADFFLTPIEAVFTRTVFDPIWGAKMTGKLGKNAVGVFMTQDKTNNLIFPSNQFSQQTAIDQDVYGGVFRFRRDIGKGSTLGILYTGRSGESYYNHLIGADGFFRLSRTKTVNFQVIGSRTRYSDEIASLYMQSQDSFNGLGLWFNFAHFGRNWRYGADYQDLSANFRADFGFVPRVDVRRFSGFIQRVLYGKRGDFYHQLLFTLNGSTTHNHDGLLTDQHVNFSVRFHGGLQSLVQPFIAFRKEYFSGKTYKKYSGGAFVQMKPTGGLQYSVYTEFADTIDYTNNRLSKSMVLNPSLEFAVGKHINVNLNHFYQRLGFEGDRVFSANLLQSKFVYNFSTRSFIRAILQYTDIRRNLDMYLVELPEKTRELFTQFLFSYKLNPQTVLFLGYSDSYLGLNSIDLIQRSRTFFLKIGYALVM